MTLDEGQKVIEQFEADGKSKEEIAGAFYLLFRDGKIDINGLEGLVNLLGFELDDDFKAMSTEDQKNYGFEVIDEDGQGESENEEDQDENEPENNQEGQSEENDEEKEEKEGLDLFEGKKSQTNDDDYDEEEEKEAKKLLKY